MNKLKTLHFFVGASLSFVMFLILILLAPEGNDYNFFTITSLIFGILSFIFLIIGVIKLSRGKIPTGEKIACPYCNGRAREYRSTTIKILNPLLSLTPKYICMQCKKTFNESNQEK